MAAEAAVLGCGVSGLSTGVRLLEAGITTEIWSLESALDSVSNVAAAFWYPYRVYPEHLISQWAQVTYRELWQLHDVPGSGVRIRGSLELFPQPEPDPWWRSIPRSFRHAVAQELPGGYGDGYIFDSPVAEMPIYLPFLQRRFVALGGTVRLRALTSIDEIYRSHQMVVNCTGLGARELFGDTTLSPVRGQIVRVSQVGIDRLLIDHTIPTASPTSFRDQPTASWGAQPRTGTTTLTRILEPRRPSCPDASGMNRDWPPRPYWSIGWGYARGDRESASSWIRPSRRPCWYTTTEMAGRASRFRGAAPIMWCAWCGKLCGEEAWR